MLPLTLQFLIAMIASAINERLQRKLDYALEEVCVLNEVLRAATGKSFPFVPYAEPNARQAGADYLVTRDRAGFAAGPLPALSPAELLALLPDHQPADAGS